MTPAEVLQQFVDALQDAALPYMLTGSHASSIHGMPRATLDVDFVVAPSREEIRRLVQNLKAAGCYVDDRAADEALDTHGQFNAIGLDSGWKADFIIRKPRAFSRTEFDRREPGVLYGVEVSVATAEDVLLAKLEWAKLGESSRQIEDAANILKVRGDRLDRAYVERWVRELGLAQQWDAAVRSAGMG
ncbi:MAG: hypothetical protein JWM27_2756 [Gemmatimonadetes bacterium]|nr:hypothetical protein [Gemmatimonadota bacterium]